MPFRVKLTETFQTWLASFKPKDRLVRQLIVARIRNMEDGHFGQTRSLGEGVSESKINYGPGYRLYFTIRNLEIVLLLVGGDKRTQEVDIQKAKRLLRNLEDE